MHWFTLLLYYPTHYPVNCTTHDYLPSSIGMCWWLRALPLSTDPVIPCGLQVGSVLVVEAPLAVPRAACSFRAGRDQWWADALEGMSDKCEVEWVDAEHPLFLLYTSGSTGQS
jgi:acyl-CoA synthetase (AMP-forming)/AMP-acid ligase II